MTTAYRVDPRTVAGVDVMGPIIEFLTLHEEGDGAPCTMRGTIPPGVVVPLHSHPDPETYVGLSGEAEALAGSVAEPGRIVIRPGDVFHVPGGARHAFRNRTDASAVMLVISPGSSATSAPPPRAARPRCRPPARPSAGSATPPGGTATGTPRRRRTPGSGWSCPRPADPGYAGSFGAFGMMIQSTT